MPWRILFAVLILSVLGGAAFLATRFHKFAFMRELAEKRKTLSWLLCLAPPAAFGCAALRNAFSSAVVMLHLILFWILADAAGWIVRKAAKKPFRRYYEGALAILVTAAYLAVGWYNFHNVRRTAYTVLTGKTIPGGHVRVVAVSDAHLGAFLDGGRFAGEMERVQSEDPDLVVVTGDFVDDDSRRADMVRACGALGDLETTYGVFYIPGNHDAGYSAARRGFDMDDLRATLAENGVVVLEDGIAGLDGGLSVVGRKDRSSAYRAEIGALAERLDPSGFSIVLDHQPNDYENEAAAGVDLVISGHTHGGHIWPAGLIGLLAGANDRVYGTETRDGTVFVVTSGIGGWGIPFKTGTFSEYVVIDIVYRDVYREEYAG